MSLAANRRVERSRAPELIFESYVKPLSGKPKETSEQMFIVEGKLRNPGPITNITVQLNEQFETVDIESSQQWHAFSLPVSLTAVPIGEEQIVKVEARVGPATYVGDTLKVIRVEDVRRQDDATYGILLLPLSLSPESNIDPAKRLYWDASRLSEIYEHVFEEFKSLTMSKRYPSGSGHRIGLDDDQVLKAFRLYHVSNVYGIAGTEALSRRRDSEVAVVRDLRSWREGQRRTGPTAINPTVVDPNLIDLVVFGDVKVDNVEVGDGEDVTMKLRAVDVESDTYLRFPIGDRDRIGVLTDASYQESSRHREDDKLREENMRAAIKVLALNAAGGIPRLAGDVAISHDNRTIRCEFGRTDRVFHHMKLWLYEKDAVRNAKLTRVDCLDLEDFDSDFSRIRCAPGQLTCQVRGCLHAVITK
jgi:hypothetical protein